MDINSLPIEEVVKESGLRHLAFIMDGNGRWAKERGLVREAGHVAGADAFRTVARYCRKIGIECVTVYAFSTENIKRPKHEVDAIFALLLKYCDEADLEKDIEFKFIGEPAEFGEKIAKRTKALEDSTAGRPYRMNIAFNYGGRAEIVRAANRAFESGRTEITEDDISENLYTAGRPAPDMIVRTGRELRISNFLIWQAAYAELYFTDRLWPDYSPADVDEAVRAFASRQRRYGGV